VRFERILLLSRGRFIRFIGGRAGEQKNFWTRQEIFNLPEP
jgi:hypothetical protein